MTRFARAKGSKASNEKLPEAATSWGEMKQELLNKNKEVADNEKRESALKRRQENYQNFLREREEEADKKITWADFPQANVEGKQERTPLKRKTPTLSLSNNILTKNKSSNKKLKKMNSVQLNGDDESEDESEDSDGQFSALKLQIDEVLSKQTREDVSSDEEPPEEVSIKKKPEEIIIKKAKKPKQKLKIVLAKEEQLLSKVSETSPKKVEKEVESQQSVETNRKKVKLESLPEKDRRLIEKKNKRRLKQVEKKMLKKEMQTDIKQPEGNTVIEKKELSAEELAKHEKKLERRKRQKEKLKMKRALGIKKKAKANEGDSIEKHTEEITMQFDKQINKIKTNKAEITPRGPINNNTTFKKTADQNGHFTESKPFQRLQEKQKAKPRDNKEHQSRKPKPEKMFINGKTIEVDYVDGFPVKKEDADRLKKLRKEMISKGLPRSEINAALKLERRRAEKAFAREKKNVCFNCRKSGHNLSECPDLNKDQVVQSAGTGICFKCGSTEHTHFECKVVKGLDYKFASCFICKEQGHIARQCPDNQRGLYPKGGSCKVCGDVTHLKKDCPKYQTQQTQLQNSLSIGTLDSGNPDDLGGKGIGNSFSGTVSRINKVVKY